MQQEERDYERIAAAIEFLGENFSAQPSTDMAAAHVHLSPFHFQKMFSAWAGISPKKFLQFLSIQYAKSLLQNNSLTLTDISVETGLSGSGRLHDLFIGIEGMTPGEYRNGGASLRIRYDYLETPFGTAFIAATDKGICALSFAGGDNLAELRKKFPRAYLTAGAVHDSENVLRVFAGDLTHSGTVRLHLKGSAFRLKVWEALLKIPSGALVTYKNIAENIDRPAASRAVGTAIGSNPVALLIPCHRVIRATGAIGGYMWGGMRKKLIIGMEAARLNKNVRGIEFGETADEFL